MATATKKTTTRAAPAKKAVAKKATVSNLPVKRRSAPAEDAPAAKKTAGKVVRGAFGRPVTPGAKRAVKRPARKPLPTFKAPQDFKPHFLLVTFATEKDGLLGARLKGTRYQGKFDRDAEDKKKFDLGAYDPQTLLGIAARLAATQYKATNDKKYDQNPKTRLGQRGAHRLPPSTTFQVLMRVGKKKEGDALTCTIRTVWQVAKNKTTGRSKAIELARTDFAFRMIRKASRILPAAFAQIQMPPKRRRGKVAEQDEE